MQTNNQRDPLEPHRAALNLVLPVWRAIDWDSVGPRRRMGIYDEFQNKIRSAAHCRSLSAFLSRLCDKMGVSAVADPRAVEVCASGRDHELLEVLRDEAHIVVLLLRQEQETWKGEEYESL